jgi:hypothetical protein
VEHGEEPDPKLVEHLFKLAKQRETVFEEAELISLVGEFKKTQRTARVG